MKKLESTVTENTNKLRKHLEIYLSDIHSQLWRVSGEVEFQFLNFKADFMEGTTKFSFQRMACGDTRLYFNSSVSLHLLLTQAKPVFSLFK